MDRSLIGCLMRFDVEKRKLFRPSAPPYPEFDGKVGLCVSTGKTSSGDIHVGVQWLKPVDYRGRSAKKSSFPLDSFIIIGGAGEDKQSR